MKIIVNPHKCEIEKTPINEKEINITKVEFEFAEEITQDYVKEAYFTLNGSTYMQIIQDNECDIPYEVLENQGTLEIGVVAYLVENTRTLAEPKIVKRYNPSPVYINTWQGSLKDEYENSEPITPTDKEQILQDLNDVMNAMDNLDIDATKVDNTATITITKKDGTTKSVEILDGEDGEDGNGIASIEKTSTSGLVDTYTITFTDGTTTTFDITNGEDGEVTQAQLDETNRQVAQANLVYNALPKVTGSGEEITLNNTAETPLKLTLKGNTYQETTSGKQLFNVNGTLYTGSIDKVNNGFKLTNNSTYRTLSILLPNPIPAGTYKVTYEMKNSTLSASNVVEISIRNSNSGLGSNRTSNTGETTITTTGEADRMYIYMLSSEASGTTVTLDNFMVSTSGGDYEPYTGNSPSPSPEYPQEVQVVTGDNTIKVNNKNLLNLNTTPIFTSNASSTFNEPSIDIIKTSSNSNAYCVFIVGDTNILNGKTLKFTGELLSGTSRAIIGYADADGSNRVVINGNYNFAAGTFERTITVDGTTYANKKVVIWLYSDTSTSGSIGDKTTFKNVMVSLDGGDYQPYQSQEYEINLGTLELCKIGDYQDYIYGSPNNWYKYTEIGKVVLDGSEEWLRTQFSTPGQYYYKYTSSGLGQQTQNGKLVYSNYFLPKNTWSEKVQGIWFDTNFVITTNGSLNDTETLAQFKTWLGTHNTNVYYVLATPTEEQITDTTLIEQLNNLYYGNSYSEQTNVSQENSNLASIMEATAVRDLSGEF